MRPARSAALLSALWPAPGRSLARPRPGSATGSGDDDSPLVRRLRGLGLSRADALLVLAAVLFGVASLGYPLGHDQGVHFYVGREWAHGALPYRDAFDYKPPGIYALYALLVASFGERVWLIRAAELAVVPLLGAACSALLRHRQRASVGLCCLLASFLYYGFFSFWDTAQCEFWCALFATGAIATALRAKRALVSAIGAGLLSACALLMKTPALTLVIIAAFLVLGRFGSRALALFSVATAGPCVATLAYFQMRGGLAALREALVGATAAYVLGGRRIHSLPDVVRETAIAFQWFNPYATIVLAGIGVAALRDRSSRSFESLRRYQMPVAMTVAAYVAVAAQLKFYRYHCVIFVPGLTVGLAEVMGDLRAAAPNVGVRWSLWAVASAYPLSGEPARAWMSATTGFVRHLAGTLEDQAYEASFAIPAMAYDWSESRRVGEWLRAHTQADEPVAVRGFFPEIYAVAGRRSPSRFFWTIPLTDPTRAYARPTWMAQDQASLTATPPRYIVTLAAARTGPDAAASFPAYDHVVDLGRLIVLQRKEPSP